MYGRRMPLRPAVRHCLAERRDVLRELERLDPEQDAHRITQLVLGRIFCDAFFHQALFTVAYWRQTAVETIAPVLARRGYGDTLRSTRKRNDDSLLFFGLIYRDGHHTPEGGRTIGRLAEIHKSFSIPLDDYRYTIASFCYEPLRIPELLGVKGLTDREARAMYLFWMGVARRWGIDIPEDQVAFRRWFHAYEQRTYRRTAELPSRVPWRRTSWTAGPRVHCVRSGRRCCGPCPTTTCSTPWASRPPVRRCGGRPRSPSAATCVGAVWCPGRCATTC
jgi:hypothetical protein